ncbi:hypothetical protein [Nocardia sp. NPDC046763]|uniref:hypothetical protein n=1 Tax=Nocardia sp. NPDC046763 TaxID=3155256 RepID=UPI0033CFCB4E
MTDNNDHWANPHGGPQGWGYPDAGQQDWGYPAGEAPQPAEYLGFAAQLPPGYQPAPPQHITGQQPQYVTGQHSVPNYPGQQPIPGYAQPPAPGGGPRRTLVILAALAAVIVLAGGGIAAYALTRDSSDSGTTAAPATTDAASSGGPSGTGPSRSGAPKPGSTTVVAPALGISYDVPAGWTIAEPTDITVQTGTDGSVIGHAKSTEGNDYCAGSAYRTLAFVAHVDGSDPAAAAVKVARISAEGGYSDATGGSQGAPVAVTTTSGVTGQQVETSGSWQPSAPGCTTTSYSIYTFAFSGPNKALLVLAILADRGTQGELAADRAAQMVASLRAS